jgi:hypothetical protein
MPGASGCETSSSQGLPTDLKNTFTRGPASIDQPGKPSAHDEGLEFELTDLEEARRILDTESVSQFDVATVVPSDRWKRLRRGSLPTDRALAGGAIDWLMALPPRLRPHLLSQQYPRITNALAEVWDDPLQCQAALDSLLCDTRKGRKGFPVPVRDELIALRKWAQMF